MTLQAQDTIRIRDSLNASFIAAAGNQLLVQGNQSVDIFALNHPDSGLFAGSDLVLRSANPVSGDAHYWSGGNFRIEQLDGSPGDLFSPYDPIIRASGDVTFSSYTGPSLKILAGGSVTVLGDITITDPDPINGLQETVTLSNGSSLAIDGRLHPTLDIRAGATAFASPLGLTGIPSPTSLGFPSISPTSADIQIGGRIVAPSVTSPSLVFLSNQHQPNPTLNGDITVGRIETSSASTNGGSVIFDSKDSIFANGISKTPTIQLSSATSKGGNLTFLARNDIHLNSTRIDSNGVLSSGSVTLTSGGKILGNDMTIRSVTAGPGIGGDIKLTAQSILLTN